jgi:nucleotidyltransferase substrate binding protein (TIGR01987 family)
MSDRFRQRLSEFTRALSRLQEAILQPQNEFMRDSVIQRFEFCYELSWKTMKLWLELKEIEALNAKDTLKEALSQKLIEDGNGWSEMHRMRNLTSHAYDEELAKEVDAFIRAHACSLFHQVLERLNHDA